MIDINNPDYEIKEIKGELHILQNKHSKQYGLYNVSSNKLELDEYKYLSFAYGSPLLASTLKSYKENQFTVLLAEKETGRGIISVIRDNGVDVSEVCFSVPLNYEMAHIISRGNDKNVDSLNYNENCLVYTSKGRYRGVYVFIPQNNQAGASDKHILKGEVPCVFDEICEYYTSSNPYSRWWNEQEYSNNNLFYVRKDNKCGVYDALEGKFRVNPYFDQVSPQMLFVGHQAYIGDTKYIIVDGEEYVPKSTLISNMIIKNEMRNNKQLAPIIGDDKEL